uniref:Ovule protein n=1 Tax=Globodera pallida TaxID=36090 RepID=A0A183CQY8_GLOPA
VRKLQISVLIASGDNHSNFVAIEQCNSNSTTFS